MSKSQFPNGLYSGGAVVFNSQPSVNFYAQLMAHEQAKRDALNQYYQSELTKTTPSGMRTQEIEAPGGFADQYNKIQEFYQQNRNALMNPSKDGFKAQTKFNQMFSDLHGTIEKSKQAAQQMRDARTIMTNSSLAPTNDDFDLLHRMGLPVNATNRKNPDGTDPDISQFSFMRKPTSVAQKEKIYTESFGKPNNWIETNQKNYVKIPGTNQYNQQTKTGFINSKTGELDIPSLQQKAQTYLLNSDKSMLDEAEREMTDPNLHNIAQQGYSKVFPNDPEGMNTPAKYLMGKALWRATQVQTGYKLASDYQQQQADKRSNIYLNATLQGRNGQTVKVSDIQLPDGTSDLTKYLQGINVNSLVTGKSFKSDKIHYNPITKEITYHDVVEDKDNTVPEQNFRNIIKTINTAQDLKTYDNLIQGIDQAFKKPNKKMDTKQKLNW